jgi:hypothetical protein
MSRRNKALLSALIVGALGSLVALGVFGLFSATTQNSGNEISTGTVALTDNDSGSALFNITGAKPGDSWTRCIKISYNGTLPANVHMYPQNQPGPLAPYLDAVATKGTQSSSTFPDCTGFVHDTDANNGVFFVGLLAAAPTGSYDAGIPINPGSQTQWNPGDSLVIKVTLTLQSTAPDSVQGVTAGNQTIVWEARNAS